MSYKFFQEAGNRRRKKWVFIGGAIFLIFLFVFPAFAGSGGSGKNSIINIVQNVRIALDNAFNNIGTIATQAQAYSVTTTDQMHPDWVRSKSWNGNLNQSVFQSNLASAISYYEGVYAATGNAPTAAEFQTYLGGLTEQYTSNTPSGTTNPQSNWDAMYQWAYNQWQSNWGRGSIQSEPPLGQPSATTVGSTSGKFNSTYTFTVSSNNQVSLITGQNLGQQTVNVTTHDILSGNVGANASGEQYTEAVSFWASPLVLDLSGKGQLEASGGRWLPHPGQLDTSRLVRFDLLGDNFPLIMEWVGPADGLLVDPSMGNCSMTHIDGTCLFGTTGGYENGYEKLAIRDKNLDGKLTGDELKGLYVWQDKDGNAEVSPSELKSVQELGITEIDVTHDAQMVAYFVKNGEKHLVWDWYPLAMEVLKQK